MTKTITCDKCNGLGYFTFEQSGADYAGVNVLRCEVCQGKGVVEVPVTNADHIRSMTDEELLGCLLELRDTAIKRFANFELPNHQWMADWLKQPYEEDT